MAEDEESFKVTDRRGRPREVAPAPSPSGESAPTASGAPRAEPAAPADPVAERDRRGPDLQGLFVMFASSALINLGEAPDPVTGEQRQDLDQARDAIDMLLLLRDKTAGNRTEQESRLLEDVLYDLQIRFVRARGRG